MSSNLRVSSAGILISAGEKVLLNQFRFTLREGEIHSIVGASGSGKSTFSMSLLGLLPDNIKIKWDEFQILSRNYDEIDENTWIHWRGKEICLVPQNPANAFHPYLSIGEQILDSFHVKKVKISKEEIFHTLSEFGFLNPKKTFLQKPPELSGGERQRILLSIAYKMNPKILVADEPTTALDAKNEKSILELMIRIVQEKKISLILVSHDRRIVRELSDRVTVINRGEFIESFPMNGSFPNEMKEYSKRLLLERELH
ncbi:MAG: ABC transporter ATP-binding protein [Leptospiraceae bacterium]|nr:ABC transporter ATP-binding protein [Leptospiraceae bacterium]MCP5511367.1 ABC transporter ATP-binding protein [Leptospiraceae bacterium]